MAEQHTDVQVEVSRACWSSLQTSLSTASADLTLVYSLVAPTESNSGISGAVTTTATFAQAPTGTYSAIGTAGSTPTGTAPASSGSRPVVGTLLGLLVASLGMAGLT